MIKLISSCFFLISDKSNYLVNAEIIVRKCEKMENGVPSKCTSLQDDRIADFSHVFNSHTNGYAKDNFVDITFTGTRCIGDAYYRPMAPLAQNRNNKNYYGNKNYWPNYNNYGNKNGVKQWNTNKDLQKGFDDAVDNWKWVGKIKKSGTTTSTSVSILTTIMTIMVTMMCV